MCGIAGYFGTRAPGESAIEATLQRMERRGPDTQQYKIIHSGNNSALLLHSRLSIIDLNERSNQPFSIGDCTLIFNGEIYNYLELRKELEGLGECFHTDSDTEVLLRAYLKWGQRCVGRFEGMWSFAIFDKAANTVILSRDRFSEKPLYILRTSHGIFFGSEIKFIKELSGHRLTPDSGKLIDFMVSGYKTIYKTEGRTFFKEVEEVPGASVFTINADRQTTLERFWKPTFHPRPMSIEEAIEGTRHHLLESIRLRLRSDVPLACCLSGGVDSSAIASIAIKNFNCDVATFSILDSDERYDEGANIRATVDDLGCSNTAIHLQMDKGIKPLQELVAYHDAPVITISNYVHSFLMREVAEHGFRVVFSGVGADELFTGYYDHFLQHLYEMRYRPDYEDYLNPWKTHVQGLIRNPFLQDPDYYANDPLSRKHMILNSDEFENCFKMKVKAVFPETIYSDSLLRNRMLNELFHEGTRPILYETDMNSMYYSVENRSPYLDSQLFDFAYSIPNELLIKDGFGKYVLREAVRGILNDKVRLDRHKKGFNASITSILNLKSGPDRDYILQDGPIYEFIHRDRIKAMLDRDGFPNSIAKFLFSFINSKIFLDQHG